MNIGDMNFHINNTSTATSGSSISAPITNPNVATNQQITGNAAITQVMEGQTFQGNVVNITGNEVQIMLDDNMMLNARMSEAVNINIGDSLSFLVQENNGSNVLIRPVPVQDNSYNFQAIQKALDANHFLPTDKNYQIAQSLMDYGMPLDRATMQQVMQQSIKYSNVPIDTLVHMNKLGLEVNEASINQFNSYMEGSHQLSGAITDFSNSITEFSSFISNEMSLDPSVTANDLMQFQNSLVDSVIKDSMGATGVADNEADLQNVNTSEQSMMNAITTSLQSAKTEGMDKLAESFSKQLAAVLSEAKNDSGQYDPVNLLNSLNKALTDSVNNSELSKDALAELLNSTEYTNLLSDAIKQKFSLNKDTLKDAGEIDNLYKKMYDASNRLQESFQNMGGKAGEQMREQAGNMKQRLDFIQNLNDMYAYAQLPVKLQDEAFNSELFVYMNKKQQQSAKEAVSALLHLDMDHLGPTDVHVSLHGTTVHTKFYVEDPVSAKLLDEHMNRLEAAVAEKGFSLTNEVVMREPSIMAGPNPVVNEMLGNDIEKSIKRYTFDVRM